MGRKVFAVLCCVVVSTGVSARTVVEEDFRVDMGGKWYFSGDGRYKPGTGAVLVEKASVMESTLSFDQLIDTAHLKVEFSFSVEAGDYGMGDGLAVGFLSSPTPELSGTGAGLLGFGGLYECSSALIVEFDTFSNAPGDFGPMEEGLFHCGVCYTPTGAIEEISHLPSIASCDLSGFLKGKQAVSLNAQIHLHGNRVVVCVGSEGGEVARVLECEIPGYIPFMGYLAFGAANGGIPGRAVVHKVRVDNDTIPAPVLEAAVKETGEVKLSWDREGRYYRQFAVLEQGDEVAVLSGTEQSITLPKPASGRHVYELISIGEDGKSVPPAGVEVFTGEPFLVVDRAAQGSTPSQEAYIWMDYFRETHLPYVRKSNIKGLRLEDFNAVVLVNGAVSTQLPLAASEKEALARYITEAPNPRLYMEGSDLFACVGEETLGAVDGFQRTSDGWPATEVLNNSGRVSAYDGGLCSVDEIAPAPEELEAGYTVLWRRGAKSDPFAAGAPVAIAARSVDERAVVVASSIELSRLEKEDDSWDAFEGYLWWLELSDETPGFRRGDVEDSGSVDIADVIFLLNYLFSRGASPPCADAADTDDSGSLGIGDAIKLLNYLFLGDQLPAPGPGVCGKDQTEDDLPECRSRSCP